MKASLFAALVAAPSAFGGDWLDPNTPSDAQTTSSRVDGRPFTLVFSDEFSVRNRSFNDGHDPRWTALHKNDYTNNAMHFYHQDFVTTEGGYMNITSAAVHQKYMGKNDTAQTVTKQQKNFTSGMVQTWNKFCFTGGVVEVRAKLPGAWMTGGLWPAIWLMGNLARATYVGSSDWVWPWSYDECDRALQPKQRVTSCSPSPHFEFEPYEGRGAPEIDILEAMAGWDLQKPTSTYKPYFSSSLQIAPGITGKDRPQKGGYPKTGSWYEGMEYGNETQLNVFFYGSLTEKPTELKTYQADALSGNTQLFSKSWDRFNTYRLEWSLADPPTYAPTTAPTESAAQETQTGESQAGESEGGESEAPLLGWGNPVDRPNPHHYPKFKYKKGAGKAPTHEGYLRWYMNDLLIYGVRGETLAAKMKSKIPDEPSYLLLNTAISSTWGFPEGTEAGCPAGCQCGCYDCLAPKSDRSGQCTCGFDKGFCAMLPAHFLVDYVRVWQDATDPRQKVGCSTPERPSKKWIDGHVKDFKNDWDRVPLLPLVKGGGPCDPDDPAECGESHGRGKCSRGHEGWLGLGGTGAACKCNKGFAGPFCRAYAASDPIDWEAHRVSLGFSWPRVPWQLGSLGLTLLAVLASTVFLTARNKSLRGGQRTDFPPEDASGLASQSFLRSSSSGIMALSGDRKSYNLARAPSENFLDRLMPQS